MTFSPINSINAKKLPPIQIQLLRCCIVVLNSRLNGSNGQIKLINNFDYERTLITIKTHQYDQ
jgi:hypothetical protein